MKTLSKKAICILAWRRGGFERFISKQHLEKAWFNTGVFRQSDDHSMLIPVLVKFLKSIDYDRYSLITVGGKIADRSCGKKTAEEIVTFAGLPLPNPSAAKPISKTRLYKVAIEAGKKHGKERVEEIIREAFKELDTGV